MGIHYGYGFGLWCALIGLVLAGCDAPKPSEARALEQSAYVWQRGWDDATAGAVRDHGGALDALYVLVMEVSTEGAMQRPVIPEVDWDAVAAAGRPVVGVVRSDGALAESLPEGASRVAAGWITLFDAIRDRALQSGVRVRELQVDYDCATERLEDYAALLRAIRAGLAGRLSITALPDWLRMASFQSVVAPLDSYTLQVHGLELPRTPEAPGAIMDAARARGWIARASALGKPFRVALPTYCYRLRYEAGGAVRVEAEDARGARTDAGTRDLCAAPVAVAGIVQALEASPPPHLRGLIWFRLPTEGDTLNWDWTTLEGVMRGEAAAPDISAEVRTPEAGLAEVWVRNATSYPVGGRVRVRCNAEPAPRASDAVGGFVLERGEGNALALVGPAPSRGDAAMAGWFRMEGGAFRVEDVEVLP